jgi:dTDP-4-dehydrorhamnose 3,5-epimerase
MKFIETTLQDCFIIEPDVISDSRGYFLESFNRVKFKAGTGLDVEFIQDNESYSSKGVLRGLHFQKGEYAQAKLVRVTEGEVLDVAVDIRPKSNTFGMHISIELTAENKKQLFIPRGFAHGFIVLSEKARVLYKCDNVYQKSAEGGIIYNDPILNINWGMDLANVIVSEKDLILQKFNKQDF